MPDQLTFSLDEAIKAQRSLRQALGLGEERFEVPEFVEMISDEIEQMRDAGKSDEDIVAVVADATGHRMDPADLDRHYIAPKDRHGGEDR
ncbi:hypothetical protein [Brevundimonas sp.]|uniref:hypothetical protein n=1 Tax=Brevundimonas sp. TaxID=1871086 RepID=UPI003D12A68F